MNTRLMALDYIKRAKRCFSEAKLAFDDEYYPITVRRSQECVKLSLKAVLRSIEIEYPREHDVSKILEVTKEKFPDWFLSKVPEFIEISRDLSKREVLQCMVMNLSLNQLLISSIKRMPRMLFQPQEGYLEYVKNLSRCTLNEIGEEKRWRNRG